MNIDSSSTCCMIVLPIHSCVRQNGESGFESHIHSTTISIYILCVYSPIVSIVSEVNGFIECQCTVSICVDCSTTTVCRVVDKVANCTEVKYSIVCEDCTTTSC